MPVFEPPIANLLPTQVPTREDGLNGLRGSNGAFVQPIEGEGAARGTKVRDFFDAKIFWKRFEFQCGHAIRVSRWIREYRIMGGRRYGGGLLSLLP